MDCDSFFLNLKTEKVIEDFKKSEDIIDFSNLDENHGLFSIKNKKVICKYKIETSKTFWIDEFIVLRNKFYAFRCGDDSKNKLKVISKSQWKNINFEENKFCLDGEGNENMCDNYILKSINHDMYLQKIRKTTLSIFDDKKNYLDVIESLPWS